MANILVVSGSVRPESINSKIMPIVVSRLEEKGAQATIADLGEYNLPFFNAPVSPTAPDFKPTEPSVIKWTNAIDEADGVVFVTPEYNHNLNPLQLNAIDWIGKEWQDKPIALIGYGWTSGAGQAHDAAREALAVNLNAKVGSTQANLFFMKDISPEGELINTEDAFEKIDASIDEMLEMI